MSINLTDDEILKKADAIRTTERLDKEKVEKDKEYALKKSLVGKFFERSVWHDGKKNVQVYRIIELPDFGFTLEQWNTHLGARHSMDASSLAVNRDYRDAWSDSDKEITAEVFYQYVRDILKRIGLYGQLFGERDH